MAELEKAGVEKMTAGRMAYLLYHQPRAILQRSMREGGPYQQWLDARGAAAMRLAAWRLPTPPSFNSREPIEVHLVTGLAYAEQSIFCLWTLAHAARRTLIPFFHDDGSLSLYLRDRLREIFPRARFESPESVQARLEKYLPTARFPVLRERFVHYPHLRKLICPHLGQRGWKLVLDSDLLFFRRPDFFLQWLEAPKKPLHLVDVASAYGYSTELLEKLAGLPVPPRLNVGVCGLCSDDLNWEQIETWCGQLLEIEGTHYLLEQALTALILTGQVCAVAPGIDYVVLPDQEETVALCAVMHHYVANSKRAYFRQLWRQAQKRVALTCEQICE